MRLAADHPLNAELAACEHRLLQPAPETTRAQLEALLADSFHEIGASGKRFDRASAIEVLCERSATPQPIAWAVSDRCLDALPGELVLHTYRLAIESRITRRSTLWHRTAQGWQALFHQGTPLPGDTP